MCFSVLRITSKDQKKDFVECVDSDDEAARIETLRARPLVVKIVVMRYAKTIEKVEVWNDSESVGAGEQTEVVA